MKTFILRTALVLSTGAVGLLAFPVAANAMTMHTNGPPSSDPVQQWVAESLPPDQFILNSKADSEVVHYKVPRKVQVCATRGPDDWFGNPERGIPVKVQWKGDSRTVEPGTCYALDAKSVQISAAGRVPENMDLTGTVKTMG